MKRLVLTLCLLSGSALAAESTLIVDKSIDVAAFAKDATSANDPIPQGTYEDEETGAKFSFSRTGRISTNIQMKVQNVNSPLRFTRLKYEEEYDVFAAVGTFSVLFATPYGYVPCDFEADLEVTKEEGDHLTVALTYDTNNSIDAYGRCIGWSPTTKEFDVAPVVDEEEK